MGEIQVKMPPGKDFHAAAEWESARLTRVSVPSSRGWGGRRADVKSLLLDGTRNSCYLIKASI